MITPAELKAHQWLHRRINGLIEEFYLPITGNGLGLRDSRLAVRFAEGVSIYLFLPQTRIRMHGVQNVDDLMTLHRLIGKPPEWNKDGR